MDQNYIIKNLDTGDTIDLRNSIQSTKFDYEQIKLQKGAQWNQFWQELHQTHYQLCEAAQQNDIQTIQTIISSTNPLPVDINMKLEDQFAPLQFAVLEQNYDVTKLLLQSSANPNITNIHSKTPLHIASIKGNFPIVQLLLQFKAQIDLQDSDYQTPLHYACNYGHNQIVEYLLQFNADHTIKNTYGEVPVDLTSDPTIILIFKAYGKLSNYSRTVFGECLLRNSRSDHVMKLLSSVHSTKDVEFKQSNNSKLHRIKKLDLKSQSKTVIFNSVGPQDFEVIQILGRGSFGQVYLVKYCKTQKIYAMKVLKKDKIMNTNLAPYIQTERNVLAVINSPFIVKLHFAFQTQNQLYLVMDYCSGGDLEQYLLKYGVFSESVVKLYAAQVLLALDELHKNCIIYRDLKISNVLLDSDGHARLTDFGLSKKAAQSSIKSQSFCGSTAYLAPEMLERKGHGFQMDWYHLGVMIFELIDGFPPYYSENKGELFKNIKKGKLKFPKNMSDSCKDIVKRLLDRNPQKRLGSKKDADEVKQHKFFKDINWNKLEMRQYEMPKIIIQNIKKTEELKVTFAISEQDHRDKNNQLDNWTFIEDDDVYNI